MPWKFGGWLEAISLEVIHPARLIGMQLPGSLTGQVKTGDSMASFERKPFCLSIQTLMALGSGELQRIFPWEEFHARRQSPPLSYNSGSWICSACCGSS
jgi:hypothetical protein